MVYRAWRRRSIEALLASTRCTGAGTARMRPLRDRVLLSRGRKASAGFVILTLALTIVMLIGLLGLCFDLSRMYIAKNELQAYSDAATLAATRHLDGTQNGITHARDTAMNYPNRWNFQTAAPDTVSVTFSANPAGPFVSNPVDAAGVKYVQVVATGKVTLYFMPGFSNTAPFAYILLAIGRQQSFTTDAASGQFQKTTAFSSGLLPYSPYAHNSTDANFGFTKGVQYTLRWPPPGQQKKNNTCAGDASFPDPSSSESQRGFIDIGMPPDNGNSSSFIREAIISSVQSKSLNKGDSVIMVTGNRGTESDALVERFDEDTDTTSASWADYYNNLHDGRANVRRLGIVPVNDPNDNHKVLGFGLFLLPADVCGTSKVAPCCGAYVTNTPVLPGTIGASTTPGVYVLKLLK
jgi:Flp pilus assembly protein TadG